jgi:uncharacterized protein
MIETTIESIRVSLVTQHRVVILKEINNDRYLPIWIGPFEADAIALELQQVAVSRPLTHDLLSSVIKQLGATVTRVLVNDLRDDTFYARIVMDVSGQEVDVDSRPSDAIALAVRVKAPIFVDEAVMDRASVTMDGDKIEGEELDEQKLEVFRDFVNTLDLEGLDESKEEGEEEAE